MEVVLIYATKMEINSIARVYRTITGWRRMEKRALKVNEFNNSLKIKHYYSSFTWPYGEKTISNNDLI